MPRPRLARLALLAVLALVAVPAAAPAATAAPARGIAQIVAADGTVVARSPVAAGWSYPEDGSVVQIADATTGGGTMRLVGISALGGRIVASQAVLGARRQVSGLVVDGRPVAAAPNTPLLVPGVGWMVILQQAIVSGAGTSARETTVALRLHLDVAMGTVPAGADILIGYAVAGADLSGAPERLTGAAADIPPALVPIYRSAGRRYGVPWSVLAAIGKVESDHGRSGEAGVTSGVNSYGCCAGPMQFSVPPAYDTWGEYAVDGNGDGRKDVYDPADAIPAAARMLAANGARTNLAGAIYVYNHAWWYVQKVLDLAKAYAAGAPAPVPVAPAAGVPGLGGGKVDPVSLS